MKAFLTEWSQDRAWPQFSDNGKPESSEPDIEAMRLRVAGMSMKEFAQSGLVMTVDSSALDERVLFVSDNTDVMEQGRSLVVYRAAELLQLIELTVEQLRKIHTLKKTFGFNIESIRQATDSRREWVTSRD